MFLLPHFPILLWLKKAQETSDKLVPVCRGNVSPRALARQRRPGGDARMSLEGGLSPREGAPGTLGQTPR